MGMREIVLREESFDSEAALCACLTSELGYERSFDSMVELAAELVDLDRPTRIVIKHALLDEPAREAMRLGAIDAASRQDVIDAASHHDALGSVALDWFDAACALLERTARGLENLDVIAYYDDLDEDEKNAPGLEDPMSAQEALNRLRGGNCDYLTARHDDRNISPRRVQELFEGGQHPYATVIACADSRVVPEHMFMAGLGELFVIRVAGNVVGEMELASAVYACEHLKTKLLLVLGHTHCGAIESAMAGEAHGPVAAVTSRIVEAIAGERDPYMASVLNVRAAVDELASNEELAALTRAKGLEIHGAIYHTHSGVVDFLDDFVGAR